MPTTASVPEIDRAVGHVERLAGERPGSLIVVEGDPTAGKSTVLSRVAAASRARGDRPVVEIRVLRAIQGMPGLERYALADDAGAVLLAMAAVQLASAAPGPWTILEQEGSWDDVGHAIRDALRSTNALVVVDDIIAGPIEPAFDSFFVQKTRDALDILLADGPTRVVTASGPRALTAGAVVSVQASSRADEVLEPARWNGLGESARALAQAADASALAELSPLELRLGVALVSRGADPQRVAHQRSRQLVHDLFARLGSEGAAFQKIIAVLALERGPFEPELLDAVGVGHLDRATRDLLVHAVLHEERGRLALHETFAREAAALGWLTTRELTTAHHAIGVYHRDAFGKGARAQDAAQSLAHELEAFHHFTQAGDMTALASVRARFTEQLDALGKSLSLAGQRTEAVTVYERAIARQPNDWYAHHYLAYNLDVSGVEPARVESEYVLARDLYPQHVWHHGRLACFYVTRARTDAARATWDRALRSLERLHGDDERLYTEVHRPLGRLLLHRGQLDFAREVLDGVPDRLRPGLAWWHALDRLWHLLVEAERDQAVFPALDVSADERWRAPHLVEPAAHGRVASWMPGRVTRVDDDGMSIRVSPRSGEFGWYDLPRSKLKSRWTGSRSAMAPGTYVEIVRWKDRVEEILVHPPAGPDRDLPKLAPPPDRYLRALTQNVPPARS